MVETERMQQNTTNGHTEQLSEATVADLTLEALPMSGFKTRVTARVDGNLVHMDVVDLAKDSSRNRFAKALSTKVPTANAADIHAELLTMAPYCTSASDAVSNASEANSTDADELLASMPKDICVDAKAMLEDPVLIQRIVDDIAVLGVAGEKELTASTYIIGVSRLLDRPLAGRIHGPSASGKSYLIEQTARLFPSEAVLLATQMTPQALFHMRSNTLSHRFIVAGERSRMEDDERAEATRALREMISSGKLSKMMPTKVAGGQIETVLIEQEGPIAFIESTTLAKIFEEDANRCITMHTDEQSAQTRRIIRQIAKGYGGTLNLAITERTIQKHHAMQRMLRRLPVFVPYAESLGELFSDACVEARRAFPQLLRMIEAVVVLHQFQRRHDSHGRLIATDDDYRIARHLLLKPLTRLLGGGLSDPAKRFYERLQKRTPGDFTTTDIRREEKCKTSMYGWLNELRDVGFVDLVEEGRGQKPARWRLTGKSIECVVEGLPKWEELAGS
jgi:hypothetical protein